MAVNANVVLIAAQLQCTQLSNPQIGASLVSAATGYTDGDVAKDEYKPLNGTTPVALNTALGAGNGYLLVVNQSALDVLLLSGATAIGTLKGTTATDTTPKMALLPLDATTVINATTTAGQTPTVGVSLVKTTPNP